MNIHTVFDLIAWASGALIGYGVRRRYLAAGTLSGFKLSQHPVYIIAVALCSGVGALVAGGGNMALADLPPLGHSVAGAIVGGIIGAEGYKLARGIKGSTGLVFVAPLAAGIAIGRWGCFLAGLPDYTYGTPTALPWGVDFGDGISRHPVQLYESLAMVGFFAWFLLALERGRRSESPSLLLRGSFYALVGFYAAQRFVWEFLKPYPKVLGPFDIFHFLMFGLFAYSLWMLWGEQRRHEQASQRTTGAETLSA
jgi:phosphatidylglycerol:prolipoprotein diacylglycerol transferase